MSSFTVLVELEALFYFIKQVSIYGIIYCTSKAHREKCSVCTMHNIHLILGPMCVSASCVALPGLCSGGGRSAAPGAAAEKHSECSLCCCSPLASHCPPTDSPPPPSLGAQYKAVCQRTFWPNPPLLYTSHTLT